MMKKILYTLCLLLLLMLASTAFAEIKIKQMYGRDFIDYCYVGDLEKVKDLLEKVKGLVEKWQQGVKVSVDCRVSAKS